MAPPRIRKVFSGFAPDLQIDSQSDYRWRPSANQITGARRGCERKGCAHRGCTRRGCARKGCTRRGCARKGCARRGCTRKGCAHRGCTRKGCACRGCARRVVGTPNQSLEPIRVVRAGVVGTLNQSV